MADHEPDFAEPLTAGAATPWTKARRLLESAPAIYDVYEVKPSVAFGFGTDETVVPTRWRFGAGEARGR